MSRIPNLTSQRGAMLVNVVLIVALSFGLSTFVVDFGGFLVARHQAQTAADAGAMAGAIARAYDDFNDTFDLMDVAVQNATHFGEANLVWGGSPSDTAVVPSYPVCPPELLGPDRCVRVDVYRNEDNGSKRLPKWFARTFIPPVPGLGVKATATARVLAANATDCLRPWAIPDSWFNNPSSSPDFTKWQNAAVQVPAPDTYTPPSLGGPGTGWRFPIDNLAWADLGASIGPTTFTDLKDSMNPINRASVVPLDLDLATAYTTNIGVCNPQHFEVGDQVKISTSPATVSSGDFFGLFDQDPGATWNAASRTITGSCAPGCAAMSPRLVAVAVFDVDLFQYRRTVSDWTTCPPGRAGCTPCSWGASVACASIVNIVGFFIDDRMGTTGHVTTYRGLVSTDPPKLTKESSFLKAVTLVR